MTAPAPDPGSTSPPIDGAGARRTVVPLRLEQAGQALLERCALAVHRTLEDDHGPYAVLRVRVEDDDSVEVTVRDGESWILPRGLRLDVHAVSASTRDRRGGVSLDLVDLTADASP